MRFDGYYLTSCSYTVSNTICNENYITVFIFYQNNFNTYFYADLFLNSSRFVISHSVAM